MKTKKDDSVVKNRPIYTATHLANYFIDNLRYVDNIRLNKLVYLSFGVAVALDGRKLFNEDIQAWRFGPVIPSIYHEFKKYGYGGVKEMSSIQDPVTNEIFFPEIESTDTDALQVLKAVKEEYGEISLTDLIGIVHDKGSPWDSFYNETKKNINIGTDTIKKYFKEEMITIQ